MDWMDTLFEFYGYVPTHFNIQTIELGHSNVLMCCNLIQDQLVMFVNDFTLAIILCIFVECSTLKWILDLTCMYLTCHISYLRPQPMGLDGWKIKWLHSVMSRFFFIWWMFAGVRVMEPRSSNIRRPKHEGAQRWLFHVRQLCFLQCLRLSIHDITLDFC
jgi:hypothetical protein